MAGDGEHHGDGMFGGGDHVAEGGVHHDDPLPGSGWDVDIVDPDPCAADDFQVVCGSDQFLGRFGGRADGEAVILRDQVQQLFLVLAELGHEVDIDAAVAEDLNGGLGKLVGDEYFGGHVGAPHFGRMCGTRGVHKPYTPRRDGVRSGGLRLS